MTIETERKPRGRGPKGEQASGKAARDTDAAVARLRSRSWAWFVRRSANEIDAPSGRDAPTVSTSPTTLPSGDVTRAHLKGLLEALIFASDRPMPANELARAAKANRNLVKELLAELSADYRGRGFRLDEVAGGFAFRTSAAYAPFVRDLALKKPIRMSRAQVETLAIVAYRQPITRPEVDDVRGVDSGPVLKTLLERDLVRILGKKDEPGRPMLYGTTNHFLEFFGLKALADLPTLREFTELSDESKRTYERELGEDAPEGEPPATPMGEGFAGGEGGLQAVASPSEDAPSEGLQAPENGDDDDDDDDNDDDEDHRAPAHAAR